MGLRNYEVGKAESHQNTATSLSHCENAFFTSFPSSLYRLNLSEILEESSFRENMLWIELCSPKISHVKALTLSVTRLEVGFKK